MQRISEGICIPLNWLHGSPSDHLCVAFWAAKKEENCPQFMQRLLQNCQNLGWQMSLKIYLLYSHLRFLPENLEAISDEQGEKFNHGIAKVEQWYQGRWDPAMVGDYC